MQVLKNVKYSGRLNRCHPMKGALIDGGDGVADGRSNNGGWRGIVCVIKYLNANVKAMDEYVSAASDVLKPIDDINGERGQVGSERGQVGRECLLRHESKQGVNLFIV